MKKSKLSFAYQRSGYRSEDQVAEILTKLLKADLFEKLKGLLGMAKNSKIRLKKAVGN